MSLATLGRTNFALTTAATRTAAAKTTAADASVTGGKTAQSGDAVDVDFSAAKPAKVSPGQGPLRRLASAAMMALALTAAIAPTAHAFCGCDTAVASAPMEILRHPNGEVIISTYGDNVVNPNRVHTDDAFYTQPGADYAALNQMGESVCKQATDLNGFYNGVWQEATCDGPNVAYLTSPTGTVSIGQNGSDSLHIVNSWGTQIRMEAQRDGIDGFAQGVGGAFFHRDGHVTLY